MITITVNSVNNVSSELIQIIMHKIEIFIVWTYEFSVCQKYLYNLKFIIYYIKCQSFIKCIRTFKRISKPIEVKSRPIFTFAVKNTFRVGVESNHATMGIEVSRFRSRSNVSGETKVV